MTQRYPQQPSRGSRQGGRPDNVRGDARYGRSFEEDAATDDMDEWDAGGRGDRTYGASADQYSQQNRPLPHDPGGMRGPGPHPYDHPRGGQKAQAIGRNQPRGQQGGPRFQGQYGGAYGPEDFRQGSGQRQWQDNAGQQQQNQYGRQGQRQFVGQGSRGASSADLGYGYGNYRQQQTLGGYSESGGYRGAQPRNQSAQPGNYAGQQGNYQRGYQPDAQRRESEYSGYAPQGAYGRDYDDEEFGQAYGGYSPSQGGYGQSWSGYGSGGYGSAYGQGFDEEYMGTSNAPVQSGAFGQGPGSYGGGFSQGLSGRGGYGMASGYTREPNDYARPSQSGKGPKGYVRSDDRLKEDISEKLTRDHAVDASDVSVDVRNGTVTLSGSVEDRQIKHYVEDMVERCSGVRDIDNRLTVTRRDETMQSQSSQSQSSQYAGQSASTGTTGSRAGGATTSSTASSGSSGGSGSGSLGGSTGADKEDGNANRKN